MSIHPLRTCARVCRSLLAGSAAVVLVAGCEAARVAQPQATPSPAEQGGAAAATLKLSPAAVAGPSASLAARVQGWNAPAAPAKAKPQVRLDADAAAEVAARAGRLERQIRARASSAESSVGPR